MTTSLTWTIEKEVRTNINSKGNPYEVTSFVVWYDKGFHAFSTFELAEEFVNNGCKL